MALRVVGLPVHGCTHAAASGTQLQERVQEPSAEPCCACECCPVRSQAAACKQPLEGALPASALLGHCSLQVGD